VAEPERSTRLSKLTPRGEATRLRIVRAAAELMHVKGVGLTTLDDVRVASGTSKSQLYRHFADKDALVHAVVNYQAEQVLGRQRRLLQRLTSFRGLERWREAVLQRNALREGAYGCEIGSLASDLADTDEEARVLLAEHFASWEELLSEGFRRMQESGELRSDADPRALATAVMAAVQGGYLMAQLAHDIEPMAAALTMAVEHVRRFASQ
jgi:TetR/AcrR family transcriptional regulator, transcriptional repressor for nem operon